MYIVRGPFTVYLSIILSPPTPLLTHVRRCNIMLSCWRMLTKRYVPEHAELWVTCR